MIEFRCPHCDNAIHADERDAGRIGWCRACKKIIIVPAADGSGGWNDLRPAQMFRRLLKLAQYAAGKADEYKLALHDLRGRYERLSTAYEKAIEAEKPDKDEAARAAVLERDLADTERQLEAAQQQCAALTERLEAHASEEAAKREVMDQLASAQEQLRHETQARSLAEEATAEAQSERDRLRAELATIEHERHELRQSVASLRDDIEDLHTSQAANMDTQRLLDEAHALADGREAQIHELRTELAAAQHGLSTFTDMEAQNASLAKEVARADEEVSHLRAALQSLREEDGERRDEISHLRARATEAEALASQVSRTAALQKETALLHEQLSAERSAVENMAAQLSELKAAHESDQERLRAATQARDERDELLEQVRTAEALARETQERDQERLQAAAQAHMERDELLERARAAEALAQAAQEHAQVADSELAALRDETDEAVAQAESSRQQVRDWQTREQDLASALSHLSSEKARLESTIASLQAEVDRLRKERVTASLSPMPLVETPLPDHGMTPGGFGFVPPLDHELEDEAELLPEDTDLPQPGARPIPMLDVLLRFLEEEE
jgi:chromosome segregation ATPase